MSQYGADPGGLQDQIREVLKSATSPPANASGGPDSLILGMTLAGLMLALLFSLIGVAFIAYAKKQARLIVGLCGTALLIFPYFVTNTYIIAAVGVALCLLPAVLKRMGVNL